MFWATVAEVSAERAGRERPWLPRPNAHGLLHRACLNAVSQKVGIARIDARSCAWAKGTRNTPTVVAIGVYHGRLSGACRRRAFDGSGPV